MKMRKEKWTCEKVSKLVDYNIGYCQAQYLLRGLTPIAYTAGIHGWNEDIYSYNGKLISTGYRLHGKTSVKYDILHEYELKAQEIVLNIFDIWERDEKLDALRDEFFKKIA